MKLKLLPSHLMMWWWNIPAPSSSIPRERDAHVHKRAADVRAEKVATRNATLGQQMILGLPEGNYRIRKPYTKRMIPLVHQIAVDRPIRFSCPPSRAESRQAPIPPRANT